MKHGHPIHCICKFLRYSTLTLTVITFAVALFHIWLPDSFEFEDSLLLKLILTWMAFLALTVVTGRLVEPDIKDSDNTPPSQS